MLSRGRGSTDKADNKKTGALTVRLQTKWPKKLFQTGNLPPLKAAYNALREI